MGETPSNTLFQTLDPILSCTCAPHSESGGEVMLILTVC